MKNGVVFDIKEFAVHDGPGVRQTVFLKGCPLRCQWCHNPEGLDCRPQLMFSRSSCIHCGSCMSVCPHPHGPCTGCGACTKVCPLGLRQIAGAVMTSSQLSAKIRENSDYYQSLNGGVTFSGGEPLMQGDFLLEVLDQITDLHTAVETCGFAPSTLFKEVISRLSFIMMDLKIMDPGLHKHFTGQDNGLILENARLLCSQSKPFVIRIPLIPGVNDNHENLEATARFLQGAQALKCVELLPYHKTAGAKYGMLGKEYRPDFDPEASIQNPQNIFEKYKIRSKLL